MYINISKVDFGRCYSGSGGGGGEEYYGMYVTPADASALNVTPNENYYTLHGKYLKYSFDGKTWNDWNGIVTIEPEQKMYLKGEDDYVWNSSTSGKLIESDLYYNVGGDISSLTNEIADVKDYTFYNLFDSDDHIKDASNLILPATTLASYCYARMFFGCYLLNTAPALPATTLAPYCYTQMFSGCSSLNSITMLATDISASSCLTNWVKGVSSTGTLNKSPEMTTLPSGASGIPEGWTVKDYGGSTVDYSQEYFTITALGDGSITLNSMDDVTEFMYELSYSKDKSNWEQVLDIGTVEIPVSSGDNVYLKGEGTQLYHNMISSGLYISSTCNINASGNIMSLLYVDDFKDKTSLPEGSQCTFGYLFKNNTHLISAENLILPATTLADSCYGNMFNGCTALTTATTLPATTLASECYSNMFKGCTSLTTAPELPANTLVKYCYEFMFDGCTSLNNITMLATNISATKCLDNWVSGVSSTGTFTKSPEMTTLPAGTSGVPSGWTVVDYGAA